MIRNTEPSSKSSSSWSIIRTRELFGIWIIWTEGGPGAGSIICSIVIGSKKSINVPDSSRSAFNWINPRWFVLGDNEISDGNGTSIWTQTSSDEPIFFGGRNLVGSYNNGWACGLDEVAIFDEEKDSNWVEHIYDTEKNGKPNDLQHESGLVGYWRFEEGGGTTVADLSGNGNHGTLSSTDESTYGLPTFSSDVPVG